MTAQYFGWAIYKFFSNVMAINYFINGVWKDANKVVTYVSLCKADSTSWYGGTKTSQAEVVRLIEAGYVVYTKVWNYPNWTNGARVDVVHTNGRKYLRTDPNATTKDNLDNSFDMNGFISI